MCIFERTHTNTHTHTHTHTHTYICVESAGFGKGGGVGGKEEGAEGAVVARSLYSLTRVLVVRSIYSSISFANIFVHTCLNAHTHTYKNNHVCIQIQI